MTFDDLKAVMNEDCSLDTAEWLKVGGDRWGADPAFLDDFFLRPADPRAFKK
jgi:ribose transport system substrate-binding protein